MTRRSYGANPETSRTRSLTNSVLFASLPLRYDGFVFSSLRVVLCPLFKPMARPLFSAAIVNMLQEGGEGKLSVVVVESNLS